MPRGKSLLVKTLEFFSFPGNGRIWQKCELSLGQNSVVRNTLNRFMHTTKISHRIISHILGKDATRFSYSNSKKHKARSLPFVGWLLYKTSSDIQSALALMVALTFLTIVWILNSWLTFENFSCSEADKCWFASNRMAIVNQFSTETWRLSIF